MPVFKQHPGQLVHIVDLAYGCDRISSMVGTNQQRLRFIIRNTADSHSSGHLLDVFIKFGPKRRIFNIVDCTVKTAFPIHDHAASLRPKMRMVINSEKQIKYAVLCGCNSKKSSHILASFLSIHACGIPRVSPL